MTVKLLIENHLEFLSLKGGCTGLSESIHVKIPHCWKAYVTAQLACNETQLAFFQFLFGSSKVHEKKCPNVLMKPNSLCIPFSYSDEARRLKMKFCNS